MKPILIKPASSVQRKGKNSQPSPRCDNRHVDVFGSLEELLFVTVFGA